MKDLILKHKKIVLIALAIITLIILAQNISNGTKTQAITDEGQKKAEEARMELENLNASSGLTAGQDATLIASQPSLTQRFGQAPDGFVWNLDGTLLSKGVKGMSPEDVVFAYLRGLSILDLETVAKFSRNSTVLKTYHSYFDSSRPPADDEEGFHRNLYKTALLSLKVDSISDTAVFAENKRVFGVSAQILDLSDKDFWSADKETIFQTLFAFERTETDQLKADKWLYDYLLTHYQSGDAKTRQITFDVTVEKYPDLDSGWLVAIDSDLDNLFSYANGTLALNQIRTEYDTWSIQQLSGGN